MDASDSDSDGAESDVYILDPTYPHSAFLRRAWREALTDTFGTTNAVLSNAMGWTYSTFLSLIRAFGLAVLVHWALIATGTWPIEHEDGENPAVVRSTWYIIYEIIKIVYAWCLPLVEYWGRLAREMVEFLVNDWFFTVFLITFAGLGRGIWVWYDRREIGVAFFVVRSLVGGFVGFLAWVFT